MVVRAEDFFCFLPDGSELFFVDLVRRKEKPAMVSYVPLLSLVSLDFR